MTAEMGILMSLEYRVPENSWRHYLFCGLFLPVIIILTLLVNAAPAATLTLHPSGEVAATDDATYTDGNGADSLDSDDGGTTYGELTGEDVWYHLNIDPHTTETGVINSVTVRALVSRTAAVAEKVTFKLGVEVGGISDFGGKSSHDLPAYVWFSEVFNDNPSGDPWTWTDIDNLTAIVDKVDKKGATMRIEELLVEVVYDDSVLVIVKQIWNENGTAPLVSPVTAPQGSVLVFLIYVRNNKAVQATDARIFDDLDDKATGFDYVSGSLVRTDAATPPADTATDKQIFDATAPATGTGLSDAVDADVASAQDTGPPAGFVDSITVGAVAGQANAQLDIGANSTFGLRFMVRVR
jgi:hypothetical protein